MDNYNPLYDDYRNGVIKDTAIVLNQQNQIYGAHHWYPLLTDATPKSYLFELTEDDITRFASGQMPTNVYCLKFIAYLIEQGYQFVKTTHKSAHAFKPILNLTDFEEQMLNPAVIMSFRQYRCQYLLFRVWTEMNLECRVYVYKRQIKYVEVYRDQKKQFKPEMFPAIIQFVADHVTPQLMYDSFTADVFLTEQGQWQVVEINSPLWLKCGTYLINYNWEKDRIHSTTNTPICRYQDSDEIIEII